MNTPLTVADAAAAANLSEKTIRRALKSGALVGSRVGVVWRIFPEDLEAWLIAQRPAPTPARKPRRRGSLRDLEREPGED